jgi:hypothetical protein
VRRIALLLALLVAVPASAAPRRKGLRYGGKAFLSIAPDLRMEGPYEDRFAFRSGVDFGVKYTFAPGARFAIGMDFRYSIRSGDRVEADFWLNPQDTWVQLREGPVTLRGGMLTMRWGRNVLLSPLNLLNPIDYTAGLSSDDPADGSIPVLAARATLSVSPASFELVFIPFFQPLRVAFYGRDFAVMRPGMLEQLLPTLIPQTGVGVADDVLAGLGNRIVDAIVGLDPYQRDGLQTYLFTAPPEELPWNGDVGLRIGLTGRGVDADFYGLWYVLDQPFVEFHPALLGVLLDQRLPTSAELTQLANPGAELVSNRNYRALMAGADVVFAGGGFVVSLEGAFRSRSVRYTTDFTPYLSPAVHWAAAVRYNWSTVVALDAEFQHDIILRPEPNTWIHRPHNFQTALGASVQLANQRLEIRLTGSYNILQRDLYVHPRVAVDVGGGFHTAFGVQIFEGFRPDAEPTLEGLRSYGGGIPGWFRGNDYAYATLEYRY